MSASTARTEDQQDWYAELAASLGPRCFPATYDHLAATLLRHHAPSHLLWRLSALPRTRQFGSLDELLGHLSAAQAPGALGADWS